MLITEGWEVTLALVENVLKQCVHGYLGLKCILHLHRKYCPSSTGTSCKHKSSKTIIHTIPNPCVCSIASINLSFSVGFSIYVGRSKMLKHVCATGRKSSPPWVGCITTFIVSIPKIGILSLPVKNTEKGNK